LLREALIRADKTSYTAGTLCTIKIEIYENIMPRIHAGQKKNNFEKKPQNQLTS
jgi:hypothetical protein